MKPKKILLILFFLLITLTGCWDQRIIEKKTFVVELGLEPAPDQKVLFTMIAPRFNIQGKIRHELFATQANLIYDSLKRSNFSAIAGDIEVGKIQHLLFSQELAYQGIHPLLEAFERSPFLPLQSSLVVVEGSPNRLLKKLNGLSNESPATLYLKQLLRRGNGQSYLLNTSAGDFEVAYFLPGIDPLLPLIKQVGRGVFITGTALFANDRMVGKLDTQQTALLLAMMNKLHRTDLFFNSTQWSGKEDSLKKGIALSITKARRRLIFKIQKNRPPEIKIKLRFQGNLLEYHWDSLDDPKKLTAMEKKLADEIKTSCSQVIRYTQQVGSDPIGFGNLIRAKYNWYWKPKDWIKTYRDAKIGFDVHLELIYYGLIK